MPRPLITLYSESFLKHRPASSHPENPKRLKIALESLRKHDLRDEVIEPRRGDMSIARKVHSDGYVEFVKRMLKNAPTYLDADTYLSEGSEEAVLHALGGCLQTVELLLSREKISVLFLVRPPGHHAGKRGRALGAPTLGFCVFNNVAIAARILIERGVERVMIVDFDVHHGNGTQEIFYSESKVVHVDLHQDPATLYPGTGTIYDIGGDDAEATKVNLILPPGGGDDCYGILLDEVLNPILKQFKPQVLLYSSGFDAYQGDGLAQIRATSLTYHRLGTLSRRVGKVAAFLEGGYSLGLSRGLPAFVAGMLGMENPVNEPKSSGMAQYVRRELTTIKDLLSVRWSL